MAQMVGSGDKESLIIELAEIGKSLRSSFRRLGSSSFHKNAGGDDIIDDPICERFGSSLFEGTSDEAKRVVDVTKLGPQERHIFIEGLIKDRESDNLKLLTKIRARVDKVGVKLPRVEVRYKKVGVEAECEVVRGKPLPTLWNSIKRATSGFGSDKTRIKLLSDVSGVIKPGRLTLLMGPPGCGKTILLRALSGNLDSSLKLVGEVSYNGHKIKEFVPQKMSAYVSQFDVHIPEMTVRETLDYSARFQGVGNQAEIMMEVRKREKEAGIIPDPDIDTFMEAFAVQGQKGSLQTDYILKILGLDVCADTLVGNATRRGISGGQKKRLTTAEMMVGPTKALFMDEITNGLDSSTALQVIMYLQQLVHATNYTVLVSLLQPTPEAFALFDDLILMSEGKIVYHGPRNNVVEFFEECGFRCPERKGVADFIQEVISEKDQAQYWKSTKQIHRFVSVSEFSKIFKASRFGKKLDEDLSELCEKSQRHDNPVSFSVYNLSNWELLRACFSRELLLMKRNSFLYIFKTAQLVIVASITMTVFLRTSTEVDAFRANYYMGALFYALLFHLLDGFPEVAMTLERLEIFYRHKDLHFYPAWAYAVPSTVLKIPFSLLQSLVWTCLTYYVIGYSPEAERFFRQVLLLFFVHLTSMSMFRTLASIFRTNMVSAVAAVDFSLIFLLIFSGYIIKHDSIPSWLRWGFWVSPLTYGEIGLSVNEFLAPRWQKIQTSNLTLGEVTLKSRGLNFTGHHYWISIGALFGFVIALNIVYILALSFLKSPGSSSGAIITHEKLEQLRRAERSGGDIHEEKHQTKTESDKGKMVLPFTPLTLVFQDLQYHMDTHSEMRKQGFTDKKIQLLANITGSFRPGVLTALMGLSGAGKTTLLDVLSGRKTSGYIEGEIKIDGYLKVQETFARISGYCEQNDVHSPHITVEESVIFSAWLRLDSHIDSQTKMEFVNEVLQKTELDGIRDALVGIPGVSGLSNEQRKRLTIAVELVSNPSIIFMDEPTTGLDARSAAIVMRAVKNIADTGRTIVCTIHQPSIDIFESFDELVLLKNGGRLIYSGPLGKNSCGVVEYFESIHGVPKIKDNCNPATWILDVTSPSVEAKIGVDFAQIYRNSYLFEANKEVVKKFSAPLPGSRDLHFPTRFPLNLWGQYKACLWKQHLSYWRSPAYNLIRMSYTFFMSLILGAVFWNQGQNINNQQNLFNVFGSMFNIVVFLGINNGSSVQQHVDRERTVMYREKFAGMYSFSAYSLAQLAVEIPYIFTQALLVSVVTYPMIGYYASAYKIFWYFYGVLASLVYFNYLGMMLVSLTPNTSLAAVVASAFYALFNLFAGFVIPKPQIPKWWIWLYYLTPTSWSLNGLLTSQYGDIHKLIDVYGQPQTVANFLNDYFGFHYKNLPLTAIVLATFPVAYALIFTYCIGRLNYQRR